MSTPLDALPPSPSLVAGLRLAERLNRSLWTLTAAYLAIGLLWLTFGAGLAQLVGVPTPAAAQRLLGLEAACFILASALAIHLYLRRLLRGVLDEYRRLADAQALLHEKFHALPCPIWLYDLGTLEILDANPAALEFFGWSRDQFIGQPLSITWEGADAEKFAQIIAKVRASEGADCAITESLRTRHGLRHVEIRSAPLHLPAGPARLVVTVDRSQEQEAQRLRDEALARLEEAQGIARIGSWELDPATGLGHYSDEVYRILGRAVPEQRRRHRFEELLAASDTATQLRIERMLGDMRTGNVQIDVLLPLLGSDRQQRMVHLRAESVHTPPAPPAIHGTFQDVTEREQSRRLLREREEQFRELVRVLPDGMMILAEERVMYANAACSAQFGFGGETILGEPLQELVADSDYAPVRELLRHGSQRDDGASTVRCMRRQDGSCFYAGLSIGDVRYGGRDCKLLVVRDLSEPERMRDALAESNRELQAMAKRLFSLQEDERRAISRDLHDDIGQAITAIKLSAHAAIAESDPAERQEDLQEIVSLADSTIVRLRNLSMLLRPPQLDALGLEAALRWQASMLFRSSPIRLHLDIQPLPGRPGNEIEQACFRIAQESLTNVLRHACAGEVTLALRPQGDRLCLQVTDDGDGFEPEGPRGLGLIMMRERAQTAGGTLSIESAPGAGTRVELYLPYHVGGRPAGGDNGR